MPLFSFDDQFALFDVTPVENLFIQEYLPGAKGDYVKVYLYGLMGCYHGGTCQDIPAMSRELTMSEDEILAAYRYWERRGLCQRISDNPPTFRYLSAKQILFMQKNPPVDKGYEEFAEALYSAFGDSRKLHGKETALCYEWVEDLGLPQEVVLMMVHHLITTRGKHFSFQAAQKLAVELAQENVRTIDDAENVLSRSKAVYEGSKKVLRRMGKRRQPSEDEMDLYLKWAKDWGYTPDAILEACKETTKGEPSFAYLNGILRGIRERGGGKTLTQKQLEGQMAKEQQAVAPVRVLLNTLGLRNLTINPGTIACYQQMQAMATDEVILLAAKETATSGGNLEDVMLTVQFFQQKELTTVPQVQAYLEKRREQNSFLFHLFQLWGLTSKPGAQDRTILSKWQEDWAFTPDTILVCAPWCAQAGKPLLYLDGILKNLHAQGIHTPEAAIANRESASTKPSAQGAKPAGKTVSHQQYEQREYKDTEFYGLTQEMLEEARKQNDA